MYPKDQIKLPPYLESDFDDIPAFAQKVAEAPMMPTTEELIASVERKDVVQAYLACITFADAQVGKLLDLCGLPQYDMADGHSLANIIGGTQEIWTYPALSFYGVGNVAVRGERYRLIQYEDGSQELYDMKQDPNEWHNLASQKSYADVISRLQSHIPNSWAPLSTFSKYNFNTYFKNK